MNLLDIYEQREPYQRAIDALEQRRIEQVREKIAVFKKSLAKATDDEMRQAISGRIKELEQELLGYHSIKNETEQPLAKGLLKGKDLVTPQQRVAGATPAKTGMMSKAADTAKQLGKWIAGKGGPGQEGPTYEDEELDEQSYGPVGSKALGNANFTLLQMAIKRQMPSQNFEFDNDNVRLTRDEMIMLAKAYNAYPSAYDKLDFIEYVMSDPNKLRKLRDKLLSQQPKPDFELTPPEQKDLLEKKSQKKKFRDTQAQRELEKARQAFPSAESDLEALIKQSMSVDSQQDQSIEALSVANQQLQQELDKLRGQTPAAAVPTPAVPLPTVPAAAIKAEPLPTPTQAEPAPAGKEPVVIPVPSDEKEPAKKEPAKAKPKAKPKKKTTTVKIGSRVKVPPQDVDRPKRLPPTDLDAKRWSTTMGRLIDPETVPQFIDLEPAEVKEHGGGIGPRQHWQSLMREQGRPPMDTLNYYFPDINAQSDVEAIRAAIREIVNNPEISKTSKQRLLGQVGMMVQRNRALIGREWRQYLDKFSESQYNEGWSDKYNPTPYAVYIDGRQWKEFRSDEEARRVADKVQDNLKRQGRNQKVTIAPSQAWLNKKVKEGTAKQFGQAVRMAGHTGRELEKDPETHKEIVRTQQQLDQRKKNIARRDAGYGEEPDDYRDVDETFAMPGTTVPRKSVIQGYTVFFNPETKTVSVTRGGDSEEAAIDQARIGTVNMKNFRNTAEKLIDRIETTLSEHITKEPRSAKERDDMIDRIRRMMGQERNPANLQIMNKDIEILQTKFRDLKEDTAALAAEDAILKRIFVKHRDLMMEYGPDKITQAAEEVSYNVGDIAHITEEQIKEWVKQVEYILGARP